MTGSPAIAGTGPPARPTLGRMARGVKLLAIVVPLLIVTVVVAPMAPVRPVAAEGCAAPTPLPTQTEPQAGGFHAVVPVRLMDTRNTAIVGAGCTAVLDLATTSAVPIDADAVALNVTATDAPGRGAVTVYPCGSPRPLASNLNPRAVQPTANSVVVQVDATRKVCLYTWGPLNLIVDLTGWFGPFGDPYHTAGGHRLLDTRTTDLRPDGGSGPLRAHTELRLPIVGLSAPEGTTAVSVNVTTTDARSGGFVTAYPCGGGRPETSTINYLAAEQRAGHTVIGVGEGGAICLWSYATVDVVVDLEGWFGDGAGPATLMRPLVGARVLDTRDGTGGVTGKVAADATVRFDPSVGGRLPIGSTVALDVVSTEADAGGFLTIYPCGSDRPWTSAVNAIVGDEATNVAFVPVDDTGEICIYAYSSMHVVVDVIGTFGANGPLHSLSVDGLSPVGPSFSPDQHDLAVRCNAGTNTLTVRATAALGATVSVAPAGQAAPPRTAGNIVTTLTVAEDDAFVVRAGRAGDVEQEYWVRCLPHDFPPIEVRRRDVPGPGWYLTDDAFPTVGSPYGYFVMILDAAGAPVWYQRVSEPSFNLTRLANGTLTWEPLMGAGFGDGSNPDAGIEIHSLDGTLLRTVQAVGTFTDHHDVAELPNGNFVVVTYSKRAGVDLSAIGMGTNQTVWDSHLQEINPAGNVVWTWRSEDHIPIADTTYPVAFAGGIDLIHVNSVQVAADGDLIVSARHTDTVYKIRRDTAGDVVWKVGGRNSDLAFVGDPDNGFARQHDAEILPNGHLRVFDNRTDAGSPRAAEYALDFSAHTATLVWQRAEADVPVSFGLGAVRSLDDDIVITWGGSTNPVYTEVDAQGREIQRLSMGGAFTYRVKKLALDAFDVDTLRATAGRA